ncbi:MAG: 3'-5' exonuclease [Bacteroidota bacterium]
MTRTTAISLNHNWRSKRHIIDFNNTFFTEASTWLVGHLQEKLEEIEDDILRQTLAALAQQLGTAYQDVYQHIPHSCMQDDQGYVNITLLADEQTESGQMLSWREKVKARLPLLIEALQRDGFALKDIAILVRNNIEGRELLQTLLTYQQSAQAQLGYRYDAISAESLYLGHSPWVNILVNALKCLADKQDCLAQAELIYLYQLHVCQEAHPLLHNYFQAATQEEGYKQHSLLPQAFLAERAYLKQLPLYECIEALISIFQLQRAEATPFIQAFQDEVLAYSQKKTADSHHFLAWWKERGHKRSIPRVEGQDAISIMTIHQAKGLQFRAVILPFCEWAFDHNAQKPPIIWCATPTPPFSAFPTLPLRYTRSLKDTVYVRDYYEEHMQAYLDNLNLLYVAFTRPEDRLYAFARRPSRGELKTTSDLLYHIFEQSQQQLDHDLAKSKAYLLWKEHWHPSANTLEVGKATPIVSSSSQATAVDTYPYLTSGWRDRLAVQPNHTLMPAGATLGVGQAGQSELVRYMLARLQKEAQLREALATLQVAQGLSQAEVDNLAQHIEELWRNPTIKAWYDGTWTVKHDASIISPRGKVYQPDRIMTQGATAIVVCFIAGPEQGQSHEQVQATATLLREMGYNHVQAYLLNLEGKLSTKTLQCLVPK